MRFALGDRGPSRAQEGRVEMFLERYGRRTRDVNFDPTTYKLVSNDALHIHRIPPRPSTMDKRNVCTKDPAKSLESHDSQRLEDSTSGKAIKELLKLLDSIFVILQDLSPEEAAAVIESIDSRIIRTRLWKGMEAARRQDMLMTLDEEKAEKISAEVELFEDFESRKLIDSTHTQHHLAKRIPWLELSKYCLLKGNSDQRRNPRIEFHERLPYELWEIVQKYLSLFYAGLLFDEFGVQLRKHQRHYSFWYDIFKDEKWLNHVVDNGGNPGLVFLEERNERMLVVLLLHKHVPGTKSREMFCSSVRSHDNSSEKHKGNVGDYDLDLKAVHGNSEQMGGNALPTPPVLTGLRYLKPYKNNASYCFWTGAEQDLTRIDMGHVTTYRGNIITLELPVTTERKEFAQFYVVNIEEVPLGRRISNYTCM
ncbi:hypothetical protein BKA63DRAFT_527375 [Paraphoma chrysanthemicola]|nr:hypothetical protein BKA63DRAFT_527375 [Paraphoma chrysanthemicola]